MSDPASREEYDRLTAERTRVDGFGLNIATHVPCPFCAHPEFMVMRPAAGIVDGRLNLDEQLAAENTCEGCGRSARSIVTRTDSGVSFEVVQTGGDDPPVWLEPKMRRVDG